MIWNSLLFIFPTLILVAALCCYKKENKVMNSFYARMSFHDVARRFYVLVVMQVLIFFLFIQSRCMVFPADTFIPVCTTALLMRFSMAEKIFYKLKKCKVMIAACLLTLALLFIPHCFSMAVTFGIYIVASIFYPSSKVRNLVNNPDTIMSLCNYPKQLVAYYY